MVVNIKNIPNVTSLSTNDFVLVEQVSGTKKTSIDELTKTGTVVHYSETEESIQLQKPDIIEKIDNMEVNLTSVSSQLEQNTLYNKTSKTQRSDEAMITFITDDGSIKDYEIWWKKVFEPLGVPFVNCMITSNIGLENWCTLEQLKEMKSNGCTIASHSHTHIKATDGTLEQLITDYKTSREILNNNGLDGDLFVVPFSINTSDSRKAERLVFQMAVCSNGRFEDGANNVDGTGKTSMNGIFDNYHIGRRGCLGETGVTLESAKADIDYAVQNKLWLIFMGHSHYDFYNNDANIEIFKELVSYAKSRAKVVNLQEGFLKKGNILDVGDRNIDNNWLVVTNKGKVYGTQSAYEYSSMNITYSTPISQFENGKVCVTSFDNVTVKGKGFPKEKACLFKTYTSVDGKIGFQELYYYDTSEIYRRYWIESKSAWSKLYRYANISQSQTYYSNATGATNANSWFKILDITLKSTTSNFFSKINYSFFDNAIGNKYSYGDIIIDCKANGTITSNPSVSLFLIPYMKDTTYKISKEDIICVSNAVDSEMKVSLYLRIPSNWRQIKFIPDLYSIRYENTVDFTFYDLPTFEGTVTPTGTVYNCIDNSETTAVTEILHNADWNTGDIVAGGSVYTDLTITGITAKWIGDVKTVGNPNGLILTYYIYQDNTMRVIANNFSNATKSYSGKLLVVCKRSNLP